MKICLEQTKGNDKFHEKSSGLVDSGFVKTYDELIGQVLPCLLGPFGAVAHYLG